MGVKLKSVYFNSRFPTYIMDSFFDYSFRIDLLD